MTRVTEALSPAPPKPKPNSVARSKPAKSVKYGIPPRKPRSPNQMPAPIVKEIVVAASPGVQTPDGSEPEGNPSEAPPTAIKAGDTSRPNNSEDVKTGETQVKASPDKTNDGETSLDVIAVVGNFFKSIVDLVNPLSESEPDAPKKKVAEFKKKSAQRSTGKRPKSKTPLASSNPNSSDDLMANEEIEVVDDGLEDIQETEPARDNDLADMLEQPESDDALELDRLEQEPTEQVAAAPKSSASARTLDRIKSLLGDDPKEDEFGLPTVEIPTREFADNNEAADDVLDQLVDSDDSPSGFLDDRPGPETGPERQPIGEDRALFPVSDALQARLRRLGDAVGRKITVDTNEILRQGRNRAADPLFQPLEKRAKTPRQVMPRRSDQVLDKAMRTETEITRRTTPADRFTERLQRIKQLEKMREDATDVKDRGGLAPTDRTDPDIADPSSQSEQQSKANAQEPAILDRMIGFFGGSQTKPSAPKSERPDPQSPDYRGAPSTRKLPEDPPAPEIENLKAFDQKDETKPAQAPGTLEPVFLNRLAGLFNEEQANQEEGWKAEIQSDNPFPGRGDFANKTGGNSWTTTVEMNVGDGKDPVIIQVAQSPEEGLERLEAEDGRNGGNQVAQRPSRPSGGKHVNSTAIVDHGSNRIL